MSNGFGLQTSPPSSNNPEPLKNVPVITDSQDSTQARIDAVIADAENNTVSEDPIVHILWLVDGVELWQRSDGTMGHSPKDARRYVASQVIRLLDQDRTALLQETERNIGMMRQWLNEDRIDDPKKMVTNDDLFLWLKALSKIKKELE